MGKTRHFVRKILPGSIAQEMDIQAGDEVLSINGSPIEDIFDYQFLIQDENIDLLLRKPDGEEWLLEIEKDEDEDLGLEFENSLMDEYRSCSNRCIFCFIDQMPPGMRETLYFKDDDSRLSFLQGNYVTLTNMKEHDLDRMIRYRLEPINISVHTTNPELRCRMLRNRFAGDVCEKIRKLYRAEIEMNGQIVLCRGINDGPELDRTIRELSEFLPYLKSLSVVPVGLSRYRKACIPWKPLMGRMPEESWRPSIAGRTGCTKSGGGILSTPPMNGICWRASRFRGKSGMTGIPSWRTAWECCGCCSRR